MSYGYKIFFFFDQWEVQCKFFIIIGRRRRCRNIHFWMKYTGGEFEFKLNSIECKGFSPYLPKFFFGNQTPAGSPFSLCQKNFFSLYSLSNRFDGLMAIIIISVAYKEWEKNIPFFCCSETNSSSSFFFGY